MEVCHCNPKKRLLICVLHREEAFPQGPQKTLLAQGTLSFLSPLTRSAMWNTATSASSTIKPSWLRGFKEIVFMSHRRRSPHHDLHWHPNQCLRLPERTSELTQGTRSVYVWVICTIKVLRGWWAKVPKWPTCCHALVTCILG